MIYIFLAIRAFLAVQVAVQVVVCQSAEATVAMALKAVAVQEAVELHLVRIITQVTAAMAMYGLNTLTHHLIREKGA